MIYVEVGTIHFPKAAAAPDEGVLHSRCCSPRPGPMAGIPGPGALQWRRRPKYRADHNTIFMYLPILKGIIVRKDYI